MTIYKLKFNYKFLTFDPNFMLRDLESTSEDWEKIEKILYEDRLKSKVLGFHSKRFRVKLNSFQT